MGLFLLLRMAPLSLFLSRSAHFSACTVVLCWICREKQRASALIAAADLLLLLRRAHLACLTTSKLNSVGEDERALCMSGLALTLNHGFPPSDSAQACGNEPLKQQGSQVWGGGRTPGKVLFAIMEDRADKRDPAGEGWKETLSWSDSARTGGVELWEGMRKMCVCPCIIWLFAMQAEGSFKKKEEKSMTESENACVD